MHQIRSSITFGWYQLNQGLGYLGEHLSKNGRYEFRVETHINIVKDDYNNDSFINYNSKNRTALGESSSIDFFLLCFWCINKLSEKIATIITTDKTLSHIKKIIELIENDDWNRVRTIWLVENLIFESWRTSINRTEYEFIVIHMLKLQKYNLECSNKLCKQNEQLYKLSFNKDGNNGKCFLDND